MGSERNNNKRVPGASGLRQGAEVVVEAGMMVLSVVVDGGVSVVSGVGVKGTHLKSSRVYLLSPIILNVSYLPSMQEPP